jgi:hypothetical protein
MIMLAVVTGADEVDELIQQGQRAYAEKNYAKTVDLFHQVIAEVQSRMGAQIGKFFPQPMKGWTAGEIETSNWSGSSGGESQSMINSSRTYTRESDGATVSMQFCNWPAVVEGTRAGLSAYSNPMMAQMMKQQGIDFKSEEKDGWQILTIVNTQSDQAQVMAFADHIMLMVQSTAGLAGIVNHYVGSVPLAELDRALQ